MSEINPGETLEALNNKVDLPTAGGQDSVDYVVEWQVPTSENNWTWYRLYKSGWIEQGGYDYQASPGRHHYNTVYFIKEMANTQYMITVTPTRVTGNYQMCIGTINRSTTSVMISAYGISDTDRAEYVYWEVKGFAKLN